MNKQDHNKLFSNAIFNLLLLVVFIFLPLGANLNGQTFTKITTDVVVNDGGDSFGCSWNDFNNDGYLDLFVTNYLNQTNFLYRNNGDNTFSKMYNGNITTDRSNPISCSWGDYDNDNDLDLFVANWEQNNFLYRNNDDDTFTRISDGVIVNDPGSSMGCSWGDYDNDSNLDLFVANYNENNCLYHNNGDGTFTKITSGDIVNDGGSSTSCNWCDYNNDGNLDLFVANWEQSNFLYRNNGDGTFTKINNGNIVNDEGNSIGASWGDYDNDGRMDLFVTNWDRKNFLYRNNGNNTFTKIINDPIVDDEGFSCGSSWGDYDNDGDLDLFVANWNEPFGLKNFLYANNGDGTFTKILAGEIVNDESHSVSCSWGDYDNDGDIDLFVTNDFGQNNYLYRNNGNSNNWINIKLNGLISNTSTIGAKVKVKANIKSIPTWQKQEISGQTGFASQNSLNAEFGLADATIIDSIKIEWPNGIVEVLKDISVNQFLVLNEPISDSDVSTEDSHPGDTVQVALNVRFPSYLTFSSAEIKLGGYLGSLDLIEIVTDSSLIGNAGWTYQLNQFDDGHLIWLAGAEEISGEGVLFWLKFVVSDTVSGFIPVILESIIFDKGDIPVNYKSGGVNVVTPFYEDEITRTEEIEVETPAEYTLSQNYPNPFSITGAPIYATTTINYSLKKSGLVQILIYNERGRLVRTLVNSEQPYGIHSVVWEGKNERGELVASGMYFYTLRVGENIFSTRRMTMIK